MLLSHECKPSHKKRERCGTPLTPTPCTASNSTVASTGVCVSTRRRLKSKVLLWSSVGILFWLCLLSFLSPRLAEKSVLGRKLLSSSECSSYPDWIEKGGIALHFVGVLYLFLGIALICDDFFVGSLESISERLGLSEDVAGATFMAAGSSAPELFSSLMALTNDDAANDIGVGTIVGSAIFNILIIIGVTALFSGQTLYLDYRPLLRDAVFYAAAVCGVIAIFHDGKVYWWEGLISVGLYFVYIVAMKYNKRVMEYLPKPPARPPRVASSTARCNSGVHSNGEVQMTARPAENGTHLNGHVAPCEVVTVEQTEGESEHTENGQQDEYTSSALDGGASCETTTSVTPMVLTAKQQQEEEDESPFSFPDRCIDLPLWLLSLPWYFAYTLTVPQCQKEAWKNWYVLTFVNSILWIGFISWFMVAWAADIGCVLGIPSAIMGVTVLAAGTSIPDALSSIVVAKEGKGDMAVANAVGSNVFDIWLGLGLPWLLVIPFKKDGSDASGKYIEVDNDELLPNVLILFGVLMLYLTSVVLAKWRLFPTEGYVFISAYAVYATYNIVAVWLLDVYNNDDD